MRAVNLKFAEMVPLSSEVLGRGGSLRFEAHGYSMSPFIRDGDALTVEPEPAETLRVGDVAFYQTADGGLAAHRVINRNMQHERLVLTLRGDATSSACERVFAEQVLGKIVRVHRGTKTIHLDRSSHRLLARLWIGLSPLHITRWIKKGKRCTLWFLQRLQDI